MWQMEKGKKQPPQQYARKTHSREDEGQGSGAFSHQTVLSQAYL